MGELHKFVVTRVRLLPARAILRIFLTPQHSPHLPSPPICSPPLSFPPIPSLPVPVPCSPLPYPPLSLEVGPLESSCGVCGSAVSSPSGVWGGAPPEVRFLCILTLKSDIWWQQF